MKRVVVILLLAVLIEACGCASLFESHRPILVSGEVISDLENFITPFNPLPYFEQRLLVRVSSPATMKNEVISLSTMHGWGSRAKTYGDEKMWERRTGVIEFEVRPSDIQELHGEGRRINVDKITVIKWPNQALVPTPMSVTIPAAQEVAPATGAAHL